jgi:ribosomal protein L12E/L44/L45/RPP1/RPP2
LFFLPEIKEVKKKKERAKELEGIDMNNIVSSSRRRTTTSFVVPPKPKIPDESDSGDSEDTDNEDEDSDDDDEDNDADKGNDDDDDENQSEELNGGKSLRVFYVPFIPNCCLHYELLTINAP